MEEQILKEIFRIKKEGHRPTKLFLPHEEQVKIAFNILSSRQGEEGLIRREDAEMIQQNGLIQFYGLPVEDGEFFVEYE